MRTVDEIKNKSELLERNYNELLHISESFTGDDSDELYEKSVLLEIDALDGVLTLLRLIEKNEEVKDEFSRDTLCTLIEVLTKKKRSITEYESRVAEAFMEDACFVEDEDMKVEIGWTREEVYVLESKIQTLRWLIENGESA